VSKGYTIVGIVNDGRKGLVQSFGLIPVQMYQFHQQAIIRRYITKSSKLLASIELKELGAMLKKTDKESFKGSLNDWFMKWEYFLNERTSNITSGKSYCVLKRIRSAYSNIKSNLPWLFSLYDYFQLNTPNMPNMTNAIDAYFADCKEQT
tara:strand:+ start:1137 stop:1586 length:450 start_codon:yes stop_codon:yes gene_type:complete